MCELRNLDTGRTRYWNACRSIRLLLSRVYGKTVKREGKKNRRLSARQTIEFAGLRLTLLLQLLPAEDCRPGE